ncbi:hypothetical protein KCU91_g15173, partial [Aureobasidium melanogenum]
MPNEILARILESLPEDDVISCRLVNKQLGAIATRDFAKANFRRLNVAFSTRSLQALVNVCTHPDLGAYVRTIWFSPFRTSPDSIYKLTDIFKKKLKIGGQGDLDCAYRCLQSYIQTSYDEHNLEKSGQAVPLLTEALSSLQKRSISVNISMDNDCVRPWIGCERPYWNGHVNDFELGRDCTNETANIIFQALFQSSCQVNRFEIYQENLGCSAGSLVDLTKSVAPALKSFAMLKSLYLNLMRLPKQKTLDSLDSVLGQLRNLEVFMLELGWDEYLTQSPNKYVGSSAFSASDAILRLLKSTCLQKVHFRHMCISEKCLVAMLSASRGSLKKLTLSGVCLTYGCWKHFFSWLHNNFRLDHLRLFALSETEGKRFMEWSKEELKSRGLYFHGKENVRSELSELLSESNALLAE